MDILPIKFISEFDQPVFGTNIFNLSRLLRSGFPVAPGVAISPPEMLLQTVLEHFQTASREVFQQRLVLVRSKIKKAPIPSELDKALGKSRGFLFKGEVFKTRKDLWQALLEIWLGQVSARLWQDGFTEGITLGLGARFVVTVESKFIAGSAFVDPNLGEVIVNALDLEPPAIKAVRSLVIEGNKKLFLPYIYDFIVVKGNVLLTGLTPFTQTLPVSPVSDIRLPQKEQKKVVKSAIKVFFNLSRGFAVPGNIDGVLIEGEKSGDFESTVFKVAESALSYPGRPVIFRLPDVSGGGVEAFLFVRNKKNILNVEIGIPVVRTPEELVHIKQELSARGITRKGTLRFWLEMAVPENILNLEDYLAVGIDGIILDLDRLQFYLGGYEASEGEFYRKQVAALIKFIQPAFKALHKAKIPVLAKGELCIYPDVLNCLIESGVWGIVANTEIEAESLPEHLTWSEKRMIAKKFTS